MLCVFSRAQKLVGRDVVSSSLTPQAALLVPISGLTDYVVDVMVLHGWQWFYMAGKRPPVKADLAIYSPINDVSG